MRTTHLLIVGVAVHVIAAGAAHADVIEIVEDQAAWESALSSQESIFFTETSGVLYDEYENLGVLFTDWNDFVLGCGTCRDGFGLEGGGIPYIDINLAFDRPRTAVAMDYPSGQQFQLFNEGELIYTSGTSNPPSGEIWFFGLLSDQPFDAVRIYDSALGVAFIDNLYFGDVIPAPGAMALLGVAAISMRGRRRRER